MPGNRKKKQAGVILVNEAALLADTKHINKPLETDDSAF
jgi:hypothetical protein